MIGALAMAIGYTVVMGWIFRYMLGTFTGSTLAPADIESFGANSEAWPLPGEIISGSWLLL